MIIDHHEIENILARLSKKIGISLEDEITMEEVIKKVQNQNLCYQNEGQEIDLLRPAFKDAFFIMNAEFVIDSDEINSEDVVQLKLLNSKTVMISTLDDRKKMEYNGSNIRVRICKELPLDLYLKIIN